ncbi:MAG: restriction endonuclease, partial [Rhodocyclaceae bacterium]|nr:restriction endonuclease [Rhodocyclaceae bacterium]
MYDYPYTITFYSYKGGVGRTLLAANIGLLRARRGKTLLWDLDVEAPGLHRIGKLSPASLPQLGFFEWLIAWQAQPKNSRPDFSALAGLALQTPVAQNLYVLPACAEGARPAELYERIRWDGFLREDLGLGLALFRDALRAMANAGFETVILDARTGYTDIGGLLAMLLPHLTVLVGNYGRQNVLGLADVWRALTPATADAGSTVASRDPLPPLKRLLVASPIVADRVDLVQAGQKVWKEAFGLLPTETLEVPFHPDLPFTEDLLAASQPDSPTALAYFELDRRIEALHREILVLTAQVDARAMAEPELGRRSTSARGKTFEQRVAQLLRLRGFEVQGETLVDANRIDLIATKKLDFGRSETWFVECKDYADNVGKDVVDTFKSWLDDPQARQRRAQGMIVASGDFAPAARAAAEAKNILALTYADLERSLFDFSDYLRRIRARYEASSLARWYVNQFVRLEKLPDAKPRELLPHALDWAAGTGSRLWLVLGDYGTGKSSFVERFAYELACRALDEPSLPVPLAINLRDYPSAVSLESLLQEHMRAELGLTVDPALLLHLLGAGRVLLLLDSFDEMGLAQAGRSMDEQLRLLIRAAASRGENALGNRILLTSRTHLFKDHGDARHAAEGHDRLFGGDSALGRSARAFDAVIDQLPLFTTDQIKDYLARRLGADEAERARKFIHDTYNLEALAEVPQLLDMMVGSLPELMARGGDVSAGALYVTYTNQWLQRYRRKAQELSAEQLRSLLEWLARLLWARPDNHIHYADLARSLHDMPDLPGGMDPQR